MHQRVGIAQALLNDPDLLVVDEPTVGLDPEERVRMRNALADTAEGRVVIFSTHIVADVEATADTVAVLQDGQLVRHEETETLITSVEGSVYECTVPEAQFEELERRFQVSNTVRRASGLEARVIAPEPPTASAEPVAATLEDAHLDTLDS